MFGSRVRMRRVLIGMSQKNWARPLGLTFQQVQKYEKGTNRIGASRLQQISIILGVPVSLLLRRLARHRGRRQGAAGFRAPPCMSSDFLSTTEGLQLKQGLCSASRTRRCGGGWSIWSPASARPRKPAEASWKTTSFL